MKRPLLLFASLACGICTAMACTGISLTSKDGSYVQARTIEWALGKLDSYYVIIPRGKALASHTPDNRTGLRYSARYGVVGLCVVNEEFIAEGINEAGLSAGLFYFPGYGSYASYDPSEQGRTLIDLQVVTWMLSRFATIDEVKEAMANVRIVGVDTGGVPSSLHWRLGEPSGRQAVLEIVNGVPRFYENEVGVLTNAPGFPWHTTNLNNYVNLLPGSAAPQQLGAVTLQQFGGNSGYLGLPGDMTPPSRFVRAAFFRATAPQQPTAFDTVTQTFHLLNNFDVPVGIEHPMGQAPDIPSATQWTSSIDLTHRRVYYKTAYNNTIRCIDLASIDFSKVRYQYHPLDRIQEQPVEQLAVR